MRVIPISDPQLAASVSLHGCLSRYVGVLTGGGGGCDLVFNSSLVHSCLSHSACVDGLK